MVREDPAIATLGVGLSEVSFYDHCTHGFIKGKGKGHLEGG